MGRVSREARLLFILLWTIADDVGRARASSRMLASLLYPYDDDAPKLIDGWLNELIREDCCKSYMIEGNSYLQITKWTDHQKIDHPTPSKLPAYISKPKPRECSRKSREEPPKSSEDIASSPEEFAPYLVPSTLDLGKDLEEDPSLRSGRARARKTALPDNFPNADGLNEAVAYWGTIGRFDLAGGVNRERDQFRDHHLKCGSKWANWDAAWRTWFRETPNRNRMNGNHYRKESEHEKLERITREFIQESSGNTGGNRSPHQPLKPELLPPSDEREPVEGVARNLLPRLGGPH